MLVLMFNIVMLCSLCFFAVWFHAKSHTEGNLETQIDDAKWGRLQTLLELREVQIEHEKAKASRLIRDLRHLIEEYEADSREDNE